MSGCLDQWFSQHILPLQDELENFLLRHAPEGEDISDLRQDILVRVYTAAESGFPHAPRAFLYTTARNLLIDRIRRRRVVSIESVMDFDALHVSNDEAGPFEIASARQELAMLQTALDTLPDRTRAVILLRRVQGLSQRETARALGVSEPTVERHISRGVRQLLEALRMRGVVRTGKSGKPQRKGRRRGL